MGRSGYSDSCEGWDLIRWRGAVKSAIRGKRGQSFLKEMASVMDAMPQKALIAKDLEQDGAVCALGSIGKARGMDMAAIDPEDRESVAESFGIPLALASEIMYENDDGEWRRDETPEQRWKRMRRWIQGLIKQGSDGIEPEGKQRG